MLKPFGSLWKKCFDSQAQIENLDIKFDKITKGDNQLQGTAAKKRFAI